MHNSVNQLLNQHEALENVFKAELYSMANERYIKNVFKIFSYCVLTYLFSTDVKGYLLRGIFNWSGAA